MGRPRQEQLGGVEKPTHGIDDELVIEVAELTEQWQRVGSDMREARARLVEQIKAAGLEEYVTHDGYEVTLRTGKDKVSVKGPGGARDPDA